MDDDDRHWFLKVLRESLGIYSVVLHFYVLMDNHFHLGVQTVKANLSEFMRRFNISYTGWFNFHHKTCGHLYQGRYKAILVDADNYLLELSRYVHLNPVRRNEFADLPCHRKVVYLNRFKWSSLPGYLREKLKIDFVHYDLVLRLAGDRCGYRDFLLDGLQHDLDNPFEAVHYQNILGNDAFVDLVRKRFLEKGSVREQPEYRRMIASKVDPEIVVACVGDAFGLHRDDIRIRRGNGIVRGILSDILYRYCEMKQDKIGEYLGVDYYAVSKLRSRLWRHLKKDRRLSQRYTEIVKTVTACLSNVQI